MRFILHRPLPLVCVGSFRPVVRDRWEQGRFGGPGAGGRRGGGGGGGGDTMGGGGWEPGTL